MSRERFSHIPTTGKMGEMIAVATIVLVEEMARGISAVNPDQRIILLAPLTFALYEIRMLFLAAKERREK